MKEIVLFLGLALGATIQPCYPPSCSIDSNCADSIHLSLGPAKCCGGTCVPVSTLPVRVVGEPCDSASHETCYGSCAANSYCGSDKKCHALPGLGCECSSATPCMDSVCSSSNATMGTCISSTPVYAAIGEPCNTTVTCRAGACDNATYVCNYLNTGDRCGSSLQCAVGVPCRSNGTFFVCAPFCALGTAGCCAARGDCPSDSRQCDTATGTCLPLLDLDGACAANSECKNGTTNVMCTQYCTSGGCNVTDFRCQLRMQIAVGQSCYLDEQCVVQSRCVNSVCTAYGSVAQGGVCKTNLDCMPPGICGSGPNLTNVCKGNGTTPIGDRCLSSAECPADADCVLNVCLQRLSIGTNCTSFSSALCLNGTCVGPTYPSSSCTSLANGCQCSPLKTVPNDGNCTSSLQCQRSDSTCMSPGVCKPIVGRNCSYDYQCPNIGGSQYDCGCNRKCYLLSGPIPTSAPSPPTPGRCDAKAIAWGNATGSYLPSLYYPSDLQVIGARFEAFNASTQALGVDYVCCAYCLYNKRFSAYTVGGYQIDCSARTIRKLPDTCDSGRAALGMLNCWSALSAAPASASWGLGALVVMASSLLF